MDIHGYLIKKMCVSVQDANLRLGINPKRRKRMSSKPWTPKELNLLFEYRNQPRKEIAKILPDRSYVAIKQRIAHISEFPGPRHKTSRPVRERFEESIQKTPEGCWLWLKSKRKGGYGRMKTATKDKMASHVAWEIYNGSIPDGMFVLHKCDNLPCVNPDHLFLGTNQDNKNDSVQKGRHAYGEKNGGGGKLTDVDILTIKDHPHYYGSRKELALKFNVTEHLIYLIRSGKIWKHIISPSKQTAEQIT